VAIIIAESASGIYFMGSLEVRKEDKKEKEGYIYIYIYRKRSGVVEWSQMF
jgi:uncharacterized protein (DUF2141 family)